MEQKETKRKWLMAFGVVLLLTVLVWWKGKEDLPLSADGQLQRMEKGTGQYEAEVRLTIDETEETELVIIVPEQRLTKLEEERLLIAAKKEIEDEFVGVNVSLEAVKNAVVVRQSYQNGCVLAEWEFSNPGLISEDGTILEEAMEKDSEVVGARVQLTCEDSSILYEFYFKVCKKEKNEEERFYEKLNQLISKNSEAEGAEFLRLPTNVEGHTLVWENKKSYLPIQIFLMGMVVLLLLPALEKEREKEVQKKREVQLLREYPEMVNKLALLLGAGMTLRGAWRQITDKYVDAKEKRNGLSSVVYEEMLITQREIESGRGEQKAYDAFGERCGLQKYRKLAGYLNQNMKKGNRGLCDLLEQEAADAFAERKSMAQQLGEEVETKLLLPMLLMLGIVIIVIMIPAVLSFQSGVN